MLYRCYVCSKVKVKKANTYKVVLKGQGYEITKHMCDPCGDQVDDNYTKGQNLAGPQDDDITDSL